MSEAQTDTTDPKQAADIEPVGQTQRQRWLRYGPNVLLAMLAATALTAFAVYLAQQHTRRIDLTQSRTFSLKPQTVQVIGGLKDKVRLISIYAPHTPSRGEAQDIDRPQVVADLLAEYRSRGRNIEIETIDKTRDVGKIEALIQTVKRDYGKQEERFRSFLREDYARILKELEEFAAAQLGELNRACEGVIEAATTRPAGDRPDDPAFIRALRLLPDRASQQFLYGVATTLEAIGDEGTAEARKRMDQLLREEGVPDYKRGLEVAKQDLEGLATLFELIGKQIDSLGERRAKIPPRLVEYYEKLGKAAAERQKSLRAETDRIGQLGSVDELDQLRRLLLSEEGGRGGREAQQAVFVLGPTQMRVLWYSQLWESTQGRRNLLETRDVRPRFNGEAQITAAIASVSQERRPTVAFIHPSIPQGMASDGRFSEVAARLKEYGFKVVEKDYLRWEMDPRQLPPSGGPEASDEELREAVWVVFVAANPMMMGMGGGLERRLREHLDRGGSAMLLMVPGGDSLYSILSAWGVRVHADMVAVRDVEDLPPAAEIDPLEIMVRQLPFTFVFNEFGDHPVTRPLAGLDGLVVQAVRVETTQPEATGVRVQPILMLPRTPRTWGETNTNNLMTNQEARFDPETDVLGPFPLGAVAEKENGGRLIVLGAGQMAMDFLVQWVDSQVLQQRRQRVARFPANGELFMNGVFWLARMDPLLSISASAMEISRIRPMTGFERGFWKIGVVMLGLPTLVILAGVGVYLRRRD